MNRNRALAAVIATVLLLAGACGNPLKGGGEGAAGGEIVIGSSDVAEARLLAYIYAGTLRNAGASNVSVRQPVGGREIVVKALQDGSLSVVPDYTGNLLRYFDKGSQATTSKDVTAALRRALPEQLRILRPAPAEDTDMLVVRPELAKRGVSTISELAPYCGELVFGGPGQWAERWRAKIKQIYGCEFKRIAVTDTGGPVTVEALGSGEIDVADLFSTSSSIQSNGFVPLEDDKNMFPAQNIVPLVASGTLTPDQVEALNDLSAVLTTDKLTQLNVQYSEQKRNPIDIAEDFLRSNGLA